MPLATQRRHHRKCKARLTPANDLDRCRCPLIVIGMDPHGIYHDREALHTRDKYIASQILREIEEGKIVRPRIQAEEWTINFALDRFESILVTQRGLRDTSIGCYRVIFRSLLKYCADIKPRPIRYLREIGSDELDEWITTWKIQPNTMQNRINTIKRMFGLAHAKKWIPTNPTLTLMCPKVNKRGATLPFDLEHELPKIMEAAPRWMEGRKFQRVVNSSVWSKYPDTAYALLLILRWTGMRWSDACTFNPLSLEKRTINGREMYCYFAPQQRKTDQPVFLPLQPEIVEPIRHCRWISDEYAFWDGKTEISMKWHHTFAKGVLIPLERVAEVAHITPHRFRDSFAVDLLNRDVDIRAVSRLMGHADPATTLQYYEHFIRRDQDKLISAVMDAYDQQDTNRMRNVVVMPAKEA